MNKFKFFVGYYKFANNQQRATEAFNRRMERVYQNDRQLRFSILERRINATA